MEVSFKPSFFRGFKKLPAALREEAADKVRAFRNPENHAVLKVHKLHGKMEGSWSFSVNYRYRIIFDWEKRNESAILLAIGDHSLYD